MASSNNNTRTRSRWRPRAASSTRKYVGQGRGNAGKTASNTGATMANLCRGSTVTQQTASAFHSPSQKRGTPAPTPPVVACPTLACTSTSLCSVHKVVPGVAETPLPSPPTKDKQETLHPPYEHKCIQSMPSAAPSLSPAPSTCTRLPQLSARTLCADGVV